MNVSHKTLLMRGAVLGVMIAIGAGSFSHAAPPHHKKAPQKKVTRVYTDAQMAAVLGEVQELKANLAAETAARVQLQAQVDQASAKVQATQAQVQADQTQLAANTAAIQTIPTQQASPGVVSVSGASPSGAPAKADA